MKKWLNEIRARFRQWWPSVEPAAATAALLFALLLSGCADMFANRTKGSYVVTMPDGTVHEARYESSKEQVGFKAKINPTTKELDVSVDRSSTQDAVTAATLQSQLQMIKLLEMLSGMAARAGAVP